MLRAKRYFSLFGMLASSANRQLIAAFSRWEAKTKQTFMIVSLTVHRRYIEPIHANQIYR